MKQKRSSMWSIIMTAVGVGVACQMHWVGVAGFLCCIIAASLVGEIIITLYEIADQMKGSSDGK